MSISRYIGYNCTMMEPPPCCKKSLSLSLPVPREQATLKPPQHLWRQPRTPIKIKHRGYSDTDRHHHRQIERSNAMDTSDRPGLKKSRMSWPSSFHGTTNTSIGNCVGNKRYDVRPDMKHHKNIVQEDDKSSNQMHNDVRVCPRG